MMDSGYEQPAPTAFARRVAKSHPWNGTEEFFARAINLRLRFAGTDPARPSELTVVNGNKADLFKRTD
jgi:hypothetical protein